MAIEPLLTPLTGEELPKSSNTSNQARTDVSAKGLRIDGQKAFCDTKNFNPLARCHLHHSLPAVYKKNENEKKQEYNQQTLQVRHGSFTPLVFMFSCWDAAVSSGILLNVLLAEEKNLNVRSVHG